MRTKAEFYRLYLAGHLGNRLRNWSRPEDVDADCPLVGFREMTAGGGSFVIVPRSEVANEAKRWTAAGKPFMLSEAAPDDRATIQGEVCRTLGGLRGLIGRVRDGKRMRDSIRDGDLLPRTGAAVLALLDRFMDASSRDDLDGFLELYPDATVEFTCYEMNLGNLPHRNTIFWEVRDY